MFRKIVKQLFLLALEQLFFLLPIAKHGKRRALVYKPDAIGDFIVWLPYLTSIARYYEGKGFEVILLCNDVLAALAERQGIFNHVKGVRRAGLQGSLFERFMLLWWLRRSGFLTVVYPVHSREFFNGDEVVRLSGARERIGFLGDNSNTFPLLYKLGLNFYSQLVTTPSGVVHEAVYGRYMVEALTGAHNVEDVTLSYNASFPVGRGVSSPYFLIFPGAGKNIRRWPIGKFFRLASKISSSTGWTIVLMGSPDEKQLGEHFRQNGRVEMIDLIGRTSLDETCTLIAGAEFVVGNDSASVHLAAALRTSSLCILGGGHLGRFFPYPPDEFPDRLHPRVVQDYMDCAGCNWQCDKGGGDERCAPCIEQISVQQVLEKFMSMGLCEPQCNAEIVKMN